MYLQRALGGKIVSTETYGSSIRYFLLTKNVETLGKETTTFFLILVIIEVRSEKFLAQFGFARHNHDY